MIKNCFNKKFYISNFSQSRPKMGLSNLTFFIKFKIVHIILVGWGWGVRGIKKIVDIFQFSGYVFLFVDGSS